jgi:hypothetical protein
MQIVVKPSDSQVLLIDIDPTESIHYFSQLIHNKTNILPSHQKLFYQGRYLNYNKTLSEYNVTSDSVVTLQTRSLEQHHYLPVSNEKKPVMLFGLISDDVIVKRIITYLDIRELVSFSLTCKNAYDLANDDPELWTILAKNLQIGQCKEDCLLILWDESYDTRKEKYTRSDAEKVLRFGILDAYNKRNDVKCLLTQDDSAVQVTIINEGKQNVRLPLRHVVWVESISLLVFDATTREYITTFHHEPVNNTDPLDRIILKPNDSIKVEFCIEGEEADRGIIVVACSQKMVVDLLKYVAAMETNPFHLMFWREQWKNLNEAEWTGTRFISNALQFMAPDVYIHPEALLLDDDECDYTESM